MKKLLILLILFTTLNANIMQDIEHFNELLKDAKSGKVLSQYWVAERYYNGNGTQVDNRQAIYWFTQSSNQGYIKSMFLLGKLFTQNATSDEIMQLGIKHFEDLANYDKKFSHLHNINSNYETKYRKRAYKELIELYIKGDKYLEADTKKAKTYFEKLKQLTQESRFAELLEHAGLFYPNEKEDEIIQADFIKLIKNGSDINARYQEDKGLTSSLLFYSIQKNNEELFELLLSKEVDINFTNERGENAFYVAIFNKKLPFAKKLYEKGIKLDFTTTKRNPLVIAALDEEKEIMEYLAYIGYKPKENIIHNKNLLAFVLADSYREAQIVNYRKRDISIAFTEWIIKKYNFDVNAQYDGYYPLHLISIKRDMSKKIELLLKLGADKTLKDKNGNTPEQFYKKEIENNNKMIKKYKRSKENKVRVITTKNKNIQGILDNGLGKQYYYKDAIYEQYNKNLEESIKLLSKYGVSDV